MLPEIRAPLRTVSAVLPVYNGAATLARCLEALTSQSPALVEILAIDDGSTDGSPAILHGFADRDPRIRIVHHETNNGLARTLNEGIKRATGDVLLILHQDVELATSDWIERGLRALEGDSRTCIVGWPQFPFQDFSTVEVAFGLLRDTFTELDGERALLTFSEFKCDLVPRSVLVRRPFDERFRASAEDQVMSMALARDGYRFLRHRDVPYVQRFGGMTTVRSQLRREIRYGLAEGGALLNTRLRMVTASAKSESSGSRLVNRAAALIAGLSLVLAAVSLVATRSAWPGLGFLLGLLPRALLVLSRWHRLRSNVRMRAGVLALAILPVNDVVYCTALLIGLLEYGLLRRV